MRAVVQRVSSSDVTVDNAITGSIHKGLTILLGVEENDESKDLSYMVDKIPNLRIFEDSAGKMNLSVQDIGGALLVISQFTLYGDCRKGRRPGFTQAARPEKAESLYREFIEQCRALGLKVETGVFQADMQVRIQNDGPVTILLDSKKTF
jgi:D-aminoacyl-tRNA deacylase